MFQFRRFPTYAYLIQRRLTEYCSAGFPHSVIHGSMRMCRSPWLIAACHDLHRLLMPRHSPCALSSLTSSEQSPLSPFPATASGSRRKAPLAPLLLLSRTDPLRWAPFAFERARASDRSSSAPFLVLDCLKNYAGIQREVPLAHCFTLFEFHKLLLVPLLLASHLLEFFFIVQFSRCDPGPSKTRLKHPSTLGCFNLTLLSTWWAKVDSNHRPHDYQSCALAS